VRSLAAVLGIVLCATFGHLPIAHAQTSLQALLQNRVSTNVLQRLERSALPRQTLQNLLSSRSAAPYLACSLPRVADLADLPGMGDLLQRFASNGQGVSYEIAVAHAYRSNINSVSAFLRGNELDGRLQSGTVIESKSAEPRRPEHLLLQLRRRAEGGQKVILALGYRPSPEYLRRLRALSTELGGRIEVHHIPLRSSTYEVLVEGRDIENPCNRRLVSSVLPSPMSSTSSVAILRTTTPRPAASKTTNLGARFERTWMSRAFERPRGSAVQRSRSPRGLGRSNLEASSSRR
jgi:hypothetical protein